MSHEIKGNDGRPPDIDVCSRFSLVKGAQRIVRFYDAHLQPAGIRITQFVIMASVRDLRSATLTELVERLEVEPRTMARMTRELRSKGFLQVQRSLPDRRSASIVLTAKGRRTLVKATALWQEAQAQLERRNDPTPDVYAS